MPANCSPVHDRLGTRDSQLLKCLVSPFAIPVHNITSHLYGYCSLHGGRFWGGGHVPSNFWKKLIVPPNKNTLNYSKLNKCIFRLHSLHILDSLRAELFFLELFTSITGIVKKIRSVSLHNLVRASYFWYSSISINHA